MDSAKKGKSYEWADNIRLESVGTIFVQKVFGKFGSKEGTSPSLNVECMSGLVRNDPKCYGFPFFALPRLLHIPCTSFRLAYQQHFKISVVFMIRGRILLGMTWLSDITCSIKLSHLPCSSIASSGWPSSGAYQKIYHTTRYSLLFCERWFGSSIQARVEADV